MTRCHEQRLLSGRDLGVMERRLNRQIPRETRQITIHCNTTEGVKKSKAQENSDNTGREGNPEER